MSNRKITYDRLEKALQRRGYVATTPSADRVVFRHPDTELPVILPRFRKTEVLEPIDLLSVQNALANGGIVPKEKFDSLFQTDPIELWHAIVDAEAEYQDRHGHPPHVLKLPVVQAYDLAKLRREQIGPLAGRVMRNGIRVLEEEGLLGIPVELVPGGGDFVFE
jgi:hypothetical protein